MDQSLKNNSFYDNTKGFLVPFLIAIIVVGGAVLYKNWGDKKENQLTVENKDPVRLVAPQYGTILPVTWGDLGAKLSAVGVIDSKRLEAMYQEKGLFSAEYRNLLYGNSQENLKITPMNAGFILNLLWALGLANKNDILEMGEMNNPRYGGAGNFASTAGWTMAVDHPMNHYNKHKLFKLSNEGQALVDKLARGIYRPCCGNSTHFPDCNHGMAMLGLLELMASQGAKEEEMWNAALAANSYWFPEVYLTIESYLQKSGVGWEEAEPSLVLGADYSSKAGYDRVDRYPISWTHFLFLTE